MDATCLFVATMHPPGAFEESDSSDSSSEDSSFNLFWMKKRSEGTEKGSCWRGPVFHGPELMLL